MSIQFASLTISRIRPQWDRFETIVGLFAVVLLTFGVAFLASLALGLNLFLGDRIVYAITLPLAPASWFTASWMNRNATWALKQCRDRQKAKNESQQRSIFALILSSRIASFPLLIRVPLGLWWLSHFGTAVFLGEMADVIAAESFLLSGTPHLLVSCLLSFSFHFAANTFLVLSIRQFTNSETWTEKIWCQRIKIDVLLVSPLFIRLLLA